VLQPNMSTCKIDYMEQEMMKELREKLEKVLEVVKGDMDTVRTGKAKPDMVGNIMVNAYGGQKMRLQELATISAPDHSLIIIEPWDKSVVQDIEKAIVNSELQLSPAVSENLIRLPVPALTEERRLDFVKLLAQKMESGKVMLRQARGDIKEEIDALEGQSGVSEDDVKRMLEEMQRVFEEYQEKLDEMGKVKEAEIMEI
jgi:ribosome recycling factor